MDLLEQLINWIKNIFTLKCPECKGKLVFYRDPTLDKNVYICTECGKEWI